MRTKSHSSKGFLHEVEKNVAKSVFHDYMDGEKQVTNLFGKPDFFPNPKPTTLIERFILQTCRPGDWVADFFAGSGTTAQAAMDASVQLRGKIKFFISEMGQHFEAVLLPRVQKTIFTPHWQDGKPKALALGEEVQARPRLVKVLHLESYEDALQNLSSKDSITRSTPRAAAYSKTVGAETYRLNYLARLPLEESASMLQLDKLEHPFTYTQEVLTDDGPKQQTVDLVETFNYLLGLDVQGLEGWENEDDRLKGKPRRYRVVKGQDRSGKRYLVVWRDMTELNPKAEREFLETRLKQDKEPFDRMLVNGDSATPGFDSLDGLFKRLMTE
jgi:adenine-specific DNA-methyltransferase